MEDLLFSSIKNFRYERKFYIASMTRENIESVLRFHPALFREIYHERTVNNIYFDSPGFSHYFSNVNGLSRRLKVRIRWYGSIFGVIENPVLELKFKHNMHVGKISRGLRPFSLGEKFSIDSIRENFRSSGIGKTILLYLLSLNFSLLNSYSRKYFLSDDRKYRVTMDSGLQACRLFSHSNSFLFRNSKISDVILEIKYNNPDDDFVDRVTGFFPFRMTRSSKYVSAVSRLYG